MKWLYTFPDTKFILTILMLACALNAFSWGPTGHRVTGWIAEKYLNKKAKREIERILGQQSLAMASTWMDEVRSDSTYDYMVDWHWVTIPDGQTYEQAEKNPNGDVIETIERMIVQLKSRALTPEKEAEYLKILIHLVGDLHQPLHVGTGNDRGGNNVKVQWFGHDSNLHRVWDSDMIDETKLSYTEFAASLEAPTESIINQWQQTGVREWAYESMSYREAVYAVGNGRLSYRYSYVNFHIVRKRLLQAGVRLAGILNQIYG